MPDEDRADDGVVTPEALYERIRAGDPVTILDLRDRDEFETWHIAGESVEALQLPATRAVQARATGSVDDLAAALGLEESVVVVCARGESSAALAEAFREAGVDAANLAGGMEGWARVYAVAELESVDEATVLQYRRPSSGCLSHLVVTGGEAAVLDPLRAFADRYVSDARDRGASLRYAIDTHVHADHVSGIRDVATRSDADAILPVGARDRGLAFDARTAADGETFQLGNVQLVAIHAPGHTSEMTAFSLDEILFTGDLLFLEGVARPDLGTDDAGVADMARRLYRTLHDRVFSMPPETVIAPGHSSDAARPAEDGTYTARLGTLCERLGVLSMDESEFVEHVRSNLPPRPANDRTIVEVNLGRRDAADADAFQLELGPNNCAATMRSV